MASTQVQSRFDRDAWLRAALEALAEEGEAKLNVEKLAARLGVTKGSFYHHFANRDAFVRALLSYWEEDFTNWQSRILREGTEPARERLFEIMRTVHRDRLTRYDIAFRSWAAQEPEVAEAVRRVDATRYETIRELFAQMGFEGRELAERTQLWLLFHSALGSVHIPEAWPVTEETLRARLDLLTLGASPKT